MEAGQVTAASSMIASKRLQSLGDRDRVSFFASRIYTFGGKKIKTLKNLVEMGKSGTTFPEIGVGELSFTKTW